MANQSYLHTPSSVSYEYISLPDKLDVYDSKSPKKEAYVFISKSEDSDTLERNSLTFHDIAERSKRVAVGLLDLGLHPGDRIAIIGPPSPEWLYVEYAVLRIRILLVRIPGTLAQSGQLYGFLNKYQCRMLIFDHKIGSGALRALKENIPDFDKRTAQKQIIGKSLQYPELIATTTADVTNLKTSITVYDLLERNKDADVGAVLEIQRQIDMDDTAVVFPTSGTTGEPKLVAYDHFGYFIGHDMILVSQTEIESTREDLNFFNNRPYTWSGAFVLTPAAKGWTMISTDDALSADKNSLKYILQILETERVDLAFLPVFLMHSVIQSRQSIPSCLQYIITAGEKVPDSVLATLLKLVRAVYIMYACTESLGAMTSGVLHGASGVDVEVSAQYRPMADCHIKITDSDGRMLPCGEAGTIWLKSSCKTEFLDDKASTDAIRSKSGWVNTKDAGIIHTEGFLQVIGRTSDMISKGGCKVYPITIETMLLKCPGVRAAVVVGLEHEEFGHEIGACVVPGEGQELSVDDLHAFCRERGVVTAGIALYPKVFKLCEQLPQLTNGKTDVLKAEQMLKQEMAKG